MRLRALEDLQAVGRRSLKLVESLCKIPLADDALPILRTLTDDPVLRVSTLLSSIVPEAGEPSPVPEELPQPGDLPPSIRLSEPGPLLRSSRRSALPTRQTIRRKPGAQVVRPAGSNSGESNSRPAAPAAAVSPLAALARTMRTFDQLQSALTGNASETPQSEPPTTFKSPIQGVNRASRQSSMHDVGESSTFDTAPLSPIAASGDSASPLDSAFSASQSSSTRAGNQAGQAFESVGGAGAELVFPLSPSAQSVTDRPSRVADGQGVRMVSGLAGLAAVLSANLAHGVPAPLSPQSQASPPTPAADVPVVPVPAQPGSLESQRYLEAPSSDIEELLDHLADRLEFDLIRTYGTSGR